MAKLDKQGLNTFIRELDKHINTKINRLGGADRVNIKDEQDLFEATNVEEALAEVKSELDSLELIASNVKMSNGTSVEDTVNANKVSISNLNNRADNLNAHIGNLINTDNVLMNNGYVVRKHCSDANSLNVNNGIFATDGSTVGVNEIGVLDHKQWDINYAYQTFHPHGKTYLRFRHKQGNVWSEWREL